jgi:hypothetical protein
VTREWQPAAARDRLTAGIDELTLIRPALTQAIERDHTPNTGDRVQTSGTVLTIPVNTDVLRALGEIPHPSYLRGYPAQFDRYMTTNAPSEAKRLADQVEHWRRLGKRAMGLLAYDRPLPEVCPNHDDHLTPLVECGDEGWLRQRDGYLVVEWQHQSIVWCRHCDTTWSSAQMLLLGRLLKWARQRRAEQAEQAA